jgi:hypothetical protein
MRLTVCRAALIAALSLPSTLALAEPARAPEPTPDAARALLLGQAALVEPAAEPAEPAEAAAPSAPAAAAVPPAAQVAARSWQVGAKAGVLLPGSVYIEAFDQSVGTELGMVAELTADATVAPKLTIGGFFLLARTTDEIAGEGARVTTLGGTIKGRFQAGKMELRPGAAIGYQLINGDAFREVKGFDVAAILEAAYPLAANRALLFELSFISQPSGGNDDSDVTFSPILFLAAGYEFGG